jgi:hypothetical protein
MELRQLPAAVARSAGVRSNRTSFSASAKVVVETGGPASGAVPNAGGAPGGRTAALGDGLRQAVSAAMRAVDARFRNRRREFVMFTPKHIVYGEIAEGQSPIQFVIPPWRLHSQSEMISTKAEMAFKERRTR